jgi:hypothetical protein
MFLTGTLLRGASTRACRVGTHAGTIPPDELLTLARRHNLEPLLHLYLGPASTPEFAAAAHASAQNSLRHTAALFRVLDALAPIECLVFKGPILAWGFYESPGLRSMSDLDMLIRKSDIPRATAALAAIGFSSTLGTADPAFYRSEMPFSHPDGIHVDLHWGLGPMHMERWFDLDRVWQRSVEVSVAGRPVRTLGPVDHIRFLTMHAAKHGFESLRDLADIARVLEKSDIDWSAVFAEARETGSMRPLVVALRLTSELLGAPIPEVQNGPPYDALVARSRANLLSDDPRPLGNYSLLARTTDKLRILLGLLQPTTLEHQLINLPRLLHLTYYLIRPLRLAHKYTLRSLRPTH